MGFAQVKGVAPGRAPKGIHNLNPHEFLQWLELERGFGQEWERSRTSDNIS